MTQNYSKILSTLEKILYKCLNTKFNFCMLPTISRVITQDQHNRL